MLLGPQLVDQPRHTALERARAPSTPSLAAARSKERSTSRILAHSSAHAPRLTVSLGAFATAEGRHDATADGGEEGQLPDSAAAPREPPPARSDGDRRRPLREDHVRLGTPPPAPIKILQHSFCEEGAIFPARIDASFIIRALLLLCFRRRAPPRSTWP